MLLISYSTMKKKIRKIRMIFDIEKFTLKVQFLYFATMQKSIPGTLITRENG